LTLKIPKSNWKIEEKQIQKIQSTNDTPISFEKTNWSNAIAVKCSEKGSAGI